MDRFSTELARQSLSAYEQEVLPSYDLLYERLIGRLTTARATMEDLTTVEVNNRANCELVTKFAEVLPAASFDKHNTWNFKLGDPFTLKAVAANIAWDGGRPYFIVGAISAKKSMSLLLVSAAGRNPHNNPTSKDEKVRGQVFTTGLNKRQRKDFQEVTALSNSDFPAPLDMVELFHNEDHMLHLGPKSLYGEYSSERTLTIYDHTTNPVSHISDYMMGKYDVIARMQNLALLFGQTDKLDRILEEHAQSRPE